MKKLLMTSVIILVCLVEIAFSQPKLTKVRVQADNWPPYSYHAPFLFGELLGFYREEGLEFELLPGLGSALVPQVVGGTKNPIFGFIDAAVLLSAREQSIPIVAIAGNYQKNTSTIFFKKDSGIEKPLDLEERMIAVNSNHFHYFHLKAFLNIVRLSQDKVKIMDFKGPPTGLAQLLLSGQVDAMVSLFYCINVVEEPPLLKGRNDISLFLFEKYGIDSIGKVIITNEETIRNNPELVRKFVRASMKSWSRAMVEPETALRVLKRRFPEVDEKRQLASFIGSLPFVKGSEPERGLGYMATRDWEKTQKVLVDTGLLAPGKINVADAFTNAFLP
jgi:ABC-type nitrate/sulfonate/bicarbonate transport system substrate-binding protein